MIRENEASLQQIGLSHLRTREDMGKRPFACPRRSGCDPNDAFPSIGRPLSPIHATTGLTHIFSASSIRKGDIQRMKPCLSGERGGSKVKGGESPRLQHGETWGNP
jgi:hypothetical protein